VTFRGGRLFITPHGAASAGARPDTNQLSVREGYERGGLRRTCRDAYYLRMNADNRSPVPIAEDQVRLVVEVFRMLADSTRIQVLWALTVSELSVNDLAERIGKPAPSVSQHLAKLRMARLVRTRRAGTTIFYSLANEHVGQLVVDAVFNAEHAGPGVPAHHQSDATVRGITDAPTRKANRR
jgi:DNA-binding transcriptional ArsR family regulator